MMMTTVQDDIKTLYDDIIVWDNHSGFMPVPEADLSNLALWKRAGVSHLSVNIGFDLFSSQDAIDTAKAFRSWIVNHSDEYVMGQSIDDIRQAKADGRMSITFDLEGMNALNGDAGMVEYFYDLGVRQMLFAYNRNNAAGGGCHDDDRGLTRFGRDVIRKMNEIGMFVDVSHTGYRTSMEAMDASEHPVIFSHSNVRAICDHQRNIQDDQITACAESGGVIGLSGVNLFLGADDSNSGALVDHIEYLVDLVGHQHVGLGLDYGFPTDMTHITETLSQNEHFWPVDQGYTAKPIKYAAPRQLVEVAHILANRGYEETAISAVLGGNFVNLAERVWKS